MARNGMAWYGMVCMYVYNIVPFGSETHSSALEPFKKRILLSMCAPVCMSVYVCPFLCACLFLCCWIHTRIWVLCAVCVYECVLSLPFWLCMHSWWSIRSCTNRNTYICVSIHKNLLAVLLASAISLHSATSLLLRTRSAIWQCMLRSVLYLRYAAAVDAVFVVCAFFLFFSFSSLLFWVLLPIYLHLFSLL